MCAGVGPLGSRGAVRRSRSGQGTRLRGCRSRDGQRREPMARALYVRDPVRCPVRSLGLRRLHRAPAGKLLGSPHSVGKCRRRRRQRGLKRGSAGAGLPPESARLQRPAATNRSRGALREPLARLPRRRPGRPPGRAGGRRAGRGRGVAALGRARGLPCAGGLARGTCCSIAGALQHAWRRALSRGSGGSEPPSADRPRAYLARGPRGL
mmetsp:Transcript_123696/g.395785  ORF Transcript_123696/g.395785 Transcript_123696/m.395785 type:complete len:209 (-) Transcript_123696:7609-8235(-)